MIKYLLVPLFSILGLSNSNALSNQDCKTSDKLSLQESLSVIKPGQKDYSMPRVNYLINKFKKKSKKKIQTYLDNKPIPYILTPKGRRIILDRHHLSQGIRHSYQIDSEKLANIKVTFYQVDCFINQSVEKFENYLIENKLVYLKSFGESIEIEDLPEKLNQMGQDFYRGLSWILKKGHLYYDLNINYSEFAWANTLRNHFIVNSEVYDLKLINELYNHLKENLVLYKDMPGFKKVLPPKKAFISEIKKLKILEK